VGLKFTVTVQDPDGASDAPQVVPVLVKFEALGPVTVKAPVKLIVTGPEFFSVTTLPGLVVSTARTGKTRLEGVTVIVTAAPIPVRLTFCGLPDALSVILRLPVSVVPVLGVKVTAMVHEEAVASVIGVAPQVAPPLVLLTEKSELTTLNPVIVSPTPLLLLSVINFAALVVPCVCFGNPRVVGEILIAGAMPVPNRWICGLFEALSVYVSKPSLLPTAVGVKVTCVVQVAPGASVEPLVHVFVPIAKSPVIVGAAVSVTVLVVAFVSFTVKAALVRPVLPNRTDPKISEDGVGTKAPRLTSVTNALTNPGPPAPSVV